MKTTRSYELKERVYQLCNKKQYFNAGSNVQYDRMFYACASEYFTVRDVAVMIWTCSVSAELGEVEREIREILDAVESEAAAESEVEFYEYESMEG